jgi:hypothetical protein
LLSDRKSPAHVVLLLARCRSPLPDLFPILVASSTFRRTGWVSGWGARRWRVGRAEVQRGLRWGARCAEVRRALRRRPAEARRALRRRPRYASTAEILRLRSTLTRRWGAQRRGSATGLDYIIYGGNPLGILAQGRFCSVKKGKSYLGLGM